MLLKITGTVTARSGPAGCAPAALINYRTGLLSRQGAETWLRFAVLMLIGVVLYGVNVLAKNGLRARA